MKKFAFALFALILSVTANASGGAESEFIVDAPISLTDKAQLQRGAQLFMNYCYGCHSLKYVRYERMATDLDIPVDLLAGNLMFNTDKVGNPDGQRTRQGHGQEMVAAFRRRTSRWKQNCVAQIGFTRTSSVSMRIRAAHGVSTITFSRTSACRMSWATCNARCLKMNSRRKWLT